MASNQLNHGNYFELFVSRVGMAINPRPAGTRPIYVIGYRVGFFFFFFIETGFNRVLNGSGFIEKPESDPNYL